MNLLKKVKIEWKKTITTYFNRWIWYKICWVMW